MSAGRKMSKIFACCRKYQHSICLKLWIMVFVCSLLCFTCLVIENRRNDIVKSRIIKSKQDAQKLIQIKSSFNNYITKNDAVEESSGFYAEDNVITLGQTNQYPIEENDHTADYLAQDRGNSQEMLAASNCISKSSDLFTTTQEVDHDNDGQRVQDYICKDLAEQVEQLLEYPEFSETQAKNIFLNYEAEIPENNTQTNDYEWVSNLEEEADLFLPQLEEEDEPIYQAADSESNAPVTWDSDDRFFPNEYAFQAKSSGDVYPVEVHSFVENANNILTESISPSDIPSMIDTFLGKISTFLVPPIHAQIPDLPHLSNFKDIPLSVEGMKLASSKVTPVWQFYSNEPKSVRSYGHHLKQNLSESPRKSRKTKIFNKRKNVALLPKLLRILQKE